MGRYYQGHISGKFWFGIQSSKDADFFGQMHKDVYHFHVCGCTAYDLVTNCTSIYCTSCYPSFSAHFLAMKAEGIAGENTWVPDGKIQYVFSKTDIQEIIEKIELLESYVGEHMDSFRIRDKDDSIQYKFTIFDPSFFIFLCKKNDAISQKKSILVKSTAYFTHEPSLKKY